MLIGAVICIPGLALRAAASGYVRKNEELATSGPYRYTRNPLYLGSLIIALGFAVAARSWSIALASALIFGVVYLPVIYSEEAFLRSRFSEFDDYARRVPRFVPRVTGTGTAAGEFSRNLYWQHREYNALLGAGAMMAALAAKLLWFCR
jgi:protein-S-isoprenylcysteine O-methyltransferase Ste14